MKKIVFYFSGISGLELKKITFLLPIYLNKKYGYDTFVVSNKWQGDDQIDNYRNVKIIIEKDPLNGFFEKNDDIALFLTIGPNWDLLPIVDKIKEKSPKCVSAIFCDAAKRHYSSGEKLKKLLLLPFTIRTYLLERKLGKGLHQRFDYMHCFTSNEYKLLCKQGILHYQIKDKLSIFPCGYDDEVFEPLLNKKVNKENIILYTGRIGVYPKNHEIIFDLLTRIKDWKDWKIVFIGSSSQEYKEKCQSFINEHSEYKNIFLLLGPIYDAEKLYDYYRKSKVFLLTSITETLNFSVVEAALFDNYLVSTNVGIVPEITNNGNDCSTFAWNDVDGLTKIISGIVSNETDYESKVKKVKETITNDFKYSAIVDKNVWLGGEKK